MGSFGTDAAANKQTALPKAVWLLSGVSFFADISSEMVYPLLPLFLVGVLGSSKTQLGLVEGAAVLLVALMTAAAGFRSDRQGRRVPWIRWGYGLPVIGKVIIALSWNWPTFMSGRLLDRFGKGLRGAPRDALLADAVTQEQRGRAFGLHRTADTAGALLGVLLAAWLLWALSGSPTSTAASDVNPSAEGTPAVVYRAIIGVGAVLGFCALAVSFFIHESKPEPGAAIARDVVDRPKDILGAWRSLPPSYWRVLAVLVLFSFANSSDTFLLLRASELGYSPWVVVLIYAVYNVTYSALSYPAGAWSDRWGRWRIIAVGWLIYAVVYAGFAFLNPRTAWSLWPLMTTYGVYMALTDGVGKALIADQAPRAWRGTALGIFYGISGVTTLLASLLAGWAWDHFGSSAAFLLGAGFAILALLGLLFLKLQRIMVTSAKQPLD